MVCEKKIELWKDNGKRLGQWRIQSDDNISWTFCQGELKRRNEVFILPLLQMNCPSVDDPPL